jgi:hypothetical protein
MAKPSKEMLTDIHQDAMKQFNKIQQAVRAERQQSLEDRRFYSIAGAQWEGNLGEQFQNKPKFEVNKIHLAVIRIVNEYRNNPISADFISKEGGEYDKLAETCSALYRADRQDSNAAEAEDNAFEEAVGGGMGAWRLRADYEDDEDDENTNQVIRFEPIYDADSTVFFDIDSKRQDKSDARHCFVLNPMSPDSFEEIYGEPVTPVQKLIDNSYFDWATPEVAYVAEYYKIEDKTETLRIFEGIDGEKESYSKKELEDDPSIEETLLATGYKEVASKRVTRKKVRKYILSGNKVLEDCGYIAGKHIPIVVTYGKRWVVDGIERCMGHVRLAKDSQRLKNMQLSKIGEIASLSSYEKPIFTPEQIKGFGNMWAEANVKNFPYLLLNAMVDKEGNKQAAGAIGTLRPPDIPPAIAALITLTDADIKEVLGSPESGEKIVSNISGKAVDMIQQKLDMQTFIYTSNHSKAVRRSGEIWLSMAQELYSQPGRKLKTVGKQAEVSSVEMMKPTVNEDGETVYENDLSDARFDIVVDVAPSTASRRAATVRALTAMLSITTDPETQQVLNAMVMMNMEGEGVSEVRDFFRKKMLKIGAVQPTEEEKKEMAQELALQAQQKDVNADLMEAMAEEATAKAAKARGDTLKTVADAQLSQAKTLEIYNNIPGQQQAEQQAAAPMPDIQQSELYPQPQPTPTGEQTQWQQQQQPLMPTS